MEIKSAEEILEDCIANGVNSEEVCECISEGGNLEDCKFEIEVEQLIGDMDKECQSNVILNFFNTQSDIADTMIGLFFGNDENNIRFSNVDLPNSLGALASTVPPANMILNDSSKIDIRFDNSYLENTTDLSIALTTAHELIHVFFIYLYINEELLTTYPNYVDMNTAFENFENNSTELTMEILQDEMHNVYDDFISDMTNATFAYAEANSIQGASEEYCRKLVIGHHLNTNAFQNLTPEEKTEYSTIAENEQNGNPDARGSKCN